MPPVADCIVDPVALGLGTQVERFGQSVLQSQADFVVCIVLARIGIRHLNGSGAAEGIPGLRIVQPGAAKGRKLFCQRNYAHQIKIQAPELDLAVQCAGRHRACGVAEIAEVKIAAFNRKVLVQLVAAKNLVTGGPVIIDDGAGTEAFAKQAAVDSGVVNGRCRAAHVGPAVPAGILCNCQWAGKCGECRQTQGS